MGGFGIVVKQMPRVLRDFYLIHAILVRSEKLPLLPATVRICQLRRVIVYH
ncbi:unnamed protein product, partial [Ectocarpus sp. 13 AM-2016]